MKLNAVLQASQVPIIPPPLADTPFGPGFVFNAALARSTSEHAHALPPSCATDQAPTPAAAPSVDRQESRQLTISRTLVLGNGTSLVFTEEDVPDPPTTSFTDNIPRLNRMWDDTSIYWDDDSVLKILGHPIPVVRWPDVYKRWKRGDWDVIKSNYIDWKVNLVCALPFPLVAQQVFPFPQAVVERYREGTPEEFWAEFRDEKGKYLSYTAIVARLTAERVEENAAIAKRARTEYGDAFSSVFSYRKGSTRIVMKDPTRIAIKYRQLKRK